MAGSFPFPRLPRGWFVAAYARDIGTGEVRTFHYFDEDIVLYRGDDGGVHAVEAHCPHLGAHLGEGGTVIGDTLRCPFHGWRFAGDGRCVEVPYATTGRVPRVSLRTWPVVETGGLVFVWYDPDGAAPAWDLPAFDTEDYTAQREADWIVPSHPQELMENTADIAHFGFLHGARNHRYLRDWRADGPLADTVIALSASGAALGAPVERIDLEIQFALFGLGYLVIDSHVPAAGVDGRIRVCATPVDAANVRVFFLSNVRKMPDPDFTSMVERLFFEAALADFKQDLRIWRHKIYRPRPVVVPGDGPILAYRAWASQFYQPRLAQAG
jgi:nitrite reductase/ring-hydroxylating ferredoxin subunit